MRAGRVGVPGRQGMFARRPPPPLVCVPKDGDDAPCEHSVVDDSRVVLYCLSSKDSHDDDDERNTWEVCVKRNTDDERVSTRGTAQGAVAKTACDPRIPSFVYMYVLLRKINHSIQRNDACFVG